MGIRYDPIHTERNRETRMDIAHDLTAGQFLALPDETEVIFLNVEMFGAAMAVESVTVNDATRADLRNSMRASGRDESSLMPYSIAIYLLPDNWVPDVSDITSGRFRSLGERHGREGAPMLSASMLSSKFPDEWGDESYATYVTAYKAASQHRKGY